MCRRRYERQITVCERWEASRGHNILQRRSVLQLRLVQQSAGLPTLVLNVDVLDSMPTLLSKTVTKLHDAVFMHMHHT